MYQLARPAATTRSQTARFWRFRPNHACCAALTRAPRVCSTPFRLFALLLLLATGDVTLPPGPAAVAWGRRVESVAARELPKSCLSAANPRHWDATEGWESWAKALEATRNAAAPDPARSAELALSAISQGRGEDAWQHFAQLGEHTDWMRALLPYFVLGQPTLELPDKSLIAPVLPPLDRSPLDRDLGLGRLEQRELWLRDTKIGPARVDVRIAVEYDGIKLEFHHLSGGDARVLVVMPEPLDFEITSVYVDWEREPQASGTHEVLISPEVPQMEIYARCKPVQVRWPTRPPLQLDERAQAHGFEVVVARADVNKPRATGLARALQAATGLDAKVLSDQTLPEPGQPRGIVLDFAHGLERARKLRCTLSALEQYAAGH